MTTAFDQLMDLELITAILTPFTRIIPMDWVLFLLLGTICLWLYLKLESAVVPAMIAIIVIGGVNLSHLFSGTENPMVPEAFDAYLILFISGIIAFLLYAIWMKK
ncbi:MAG: hypothetical protein B6U72_03035 [Candidatus Altiarchaeales archaeon ex4484_2]|nr:MAG: hypothetical protein B6U72_03035 [Candidatus Altiarchaeales archaeon ex4484_2]